MVRYYEDDGVTINTITAIGIKNGIGRGCYSILSTSGEFVVNGVHEELPDVSSLVNGGKYISMYNGSWCIVYIHNGAVRKIDPNIPYSLIRDLETGFNWYWVGGILKREDDFLTPSQVNEVVKESAYKVQKPIISVSLFNKDNVLEKGKSLVYPTFNFSVKDLDENDITSNCTIKVTSNIFGEESIKSYSNNILILQGTIDQTITYTFTVSYVINGNTYSVSKDYKIIFIPKTYYGKFNSLSDFITTKPDEILWGGIENEFIITTDLDDERIAVLVPSVIDRFIGIYDKHGLDYIDDYNIQTGIQYKGNSYTLYIKKDPVRINDFKQVFTK